MYRIPKKKNLKICLLQEFSTHYKIVQKLQDKKLFLKKNLLILQDV